MTALAFFFVASSFAALNVKVYNPGAKAIFPVSSTIIYGEKEAILVDAQFQKQYAEELVREIKALNKKLTLVYVSYVDPDYYFGLDVIHKNFPEAKIVSTAQTAYLISASKDAKMAVWKDQLKTDAPSEIIVPEAISSILDLEGAQIEIKQRADDPEHSFLWIPSLKTILGGVSVSIGSHIWMADTQSPAAISKWIREIDDMKALKPLRVIPSHFVTSDFAPQSLNFVRNYLVNYQTATRLYKKSNQIVAYMTQKYPQLPGKDELTMGAKVFTGEMVWEQKELYPAVGKDLVADFGTFSFQLSFKDHKTMLFVGLSGDYKGVTDTVQYTAVEIAKNIFMVYWHEPKVGANVVHVQNFNNHTVYTNIAGTDGSFYHTKGTLKVMN